MPVGHRRNQSQTHPQGLRPGGQETGAAAAAMAKCKILAGHQMAGAEALMQHCLDEIVGGHEAEMKVEGKFIQQIDPESGQVLPEGAEGELTFTSLTKEGMPVIRYRTRDLTRLLPGRATAMRRIAKITGRTDDMLIIRGVNVFPSQIEEQILHCQGLAPHYEIEISRPHRLDEVRVSVEARSELSADAHQAEAALLATKLKALIGISAEIRVVSFGSLRRSTGKAARVNDRRQRDAGKA